MYSPSKCDTNHALMSWVFPSAQRTISYNEFKPATDMVSQHVFRSRIRMGAIAQNHIAPPPGRTHSRHSFHAFHCCRQCVYLHRFSSPLQHVASVHSWSIDELHVYAENERIWHLLHAHMQFTYTKNGVHQHWISNCREFQRVPQSASTCLFANSPHARFFGLPSWAWRPASFERRQRSPVRSMSPLSSLLRAVCLHPLAHTSRWSLGFKRTHFLSIHNCQFSPKNI